MKSGGTIVKSVILWLLVALIASLTGNAYLWRELTALTTVPVPARDPSGPDNTIPPPASGGSVSLLDSYNGLRQQVNRRLGLGRDAQTFITPENPAVAAVVKELTRASNGDPKEYWRNCELLYRWVVQNTLYVPDSCSPLLPEAVNGKIAWINDSWRMPEETLRDKAGDCEDLSALLTSLLLNYNRHVYGVWMVEVGNAESGHIGVVFPIEKGMITIVDPSIKYNTAAGDGLALTSRDARTELALWLERLGDRVPDARVKRVFSDTLYQEFTGTEDFLNWVATSVK
jgi:hypothetical protein